MKKLSAPREVSPAGRLRSGLGRFAGPVVGPPDAAPFDDGPSDGDGVPASFPDEQPATPSRPAAAAPAPAIWIKPRRLSCISRMGIPLSRLFRIKWFELWLVGARGARRRTPPRG